ncbi:MAG TPA: 4-hydroxy-3-methylbut-2-enyl diphosphate reductase, partial [Armatimonadetes bacterium]|nr:4-hydroxy-3-methylbut-2-enyl diphosphate reductase [Armatimonadota bacterium]
GVERAVRMAKEAAERAKGKVYSYGQLVHNRLVVEHLRGLGIEPLEEISPDVPRRGDVLIIRAHGAPPEVFREMAGRGVEVVDTTCPIVKEARGKAMALMGEGYEVIIVGDGGHPEVKGIVGCLEGRAKVVRGASEAKRMDLPPKVGVVAQTTESLDELAEVVSAVLPRVRELKVVNTICGAVIRRQQEVEKLAKECEVVVVVGGKNSANTRRLAGIASKFCPNVIHIEEPSELDKVRIPREVRCVGVSGGTSTPRESVDEVVWKLQRILKGV